MKQSKHRVGVGVNSHGSGVCVIVGVAVAGQPDTDAGMKQSKHKVGVGVSSHGSGVCVVVGVAVAGQPPASGKCWLGTKQSKQNGVAVGVIVAVTHGSMAVAV